MVRPTKDAYFLAVASVIAVRSTCSRRSVGCVLVDKAGRVLATGYNGVACGQPHCSEGFRCTGADAKSGTQLEACQAIHAEQNALVWCRESERIYTAYVTTAPCVSCTKLLLSTSCERIIFVEDYDQGGVNRDLWIGAGRVWEQRVAHS